MTNVSSLSSLLARTLWAVGIVLATVGAAQAQLFNITGISLSTGPSGQSVVVAGDNAVIATVTTVRFTGLGSGATTGPTLGAITATNAVGIASATVVVPSLADGNYSITFQVAGVNNSSDITFTVNNALPLPVQLVAFTAEATGTAARLRWHTASEQDNAYFDVEASTDGRTFARVGGVAGHGTTLLPQQYDFTDENLSRYGVALLYYRLRQVDFDGTSTFSEVRTVAAAAGRLSLTLYPTVAAARQAPHYTYAGPALAAGATLEVYNSTGQRVLTQPLGESAGTLSSAALPAGWYWVRVAGTSAVARFCQP